MQAMYFVTLKDWEQRKGEGQSVNDVIGKGSLYINGESRMIRVMTWQNSKDVFK